MPFVKSIRTALLAFAVGLVAAPSSFAAAFQSIGSGDWNSGSTWNQLGAVPGSGDSVQINDGHTVTVTTTADIAGSLSFGTLALGATLQINPGAKLTVVGNVDVDADALGPATLDVASGTLIAGGNINISEGSTGGTATLRIGAGAASAVGSVTFTQVFNNARIDFTGTGLLSLKGSLDSDGTLINHAAGAGSTVKFDGTGSQIIGNYTYQNLGIANTGASAVEATGSITVNGTLAMQSGFFLVKSAFSAGGTSTLQMMGTSVLKLGDATVLTGVTMPNFGSYSMASTSTIYYGAGANQTINPLVPYQHLIVAYTGSTQNPVKQFGGSATIAGDLTIDQQTPGTVTLETGSGIVTVAGSLLGDGGLTSSLSGELRLAGNFMNTGAFSGGTGLFTYNGGQFQNVRPVAYNDLYITGLNTNATLSSNGGSAVTLTIDGNSYFDLSTSFSVSGDLTVNGFLNGTGDTLTLTSSGGSILGSGEIYAHVISNTRAIVPAADLLFGGNFTVNTSETVTNNGTVEILNSLIGTSSTWINAANSSLKVGGNVMASGTLNATANPNTVSYNGLGQTVLSTTYHNLILTTPGFTPGLKTMPAGLIAVNNDFTIGGAANVAPANGISVNGDFTLTGTATFVAGGFGYPIMGNWTQSGGTFTSGTSVVQFNGGNQTISGTTAFHHLDFDGTGTKTLTGNLDLGGDFSIFSGVAVLGGSYTINVAGNWVDTGSTFVPGTSTVIMDGTTAESIVGTFHKLQIAKSSGGSVTLAGDATTVDFDLVSDGFDLGSSNLDVADDFKTFSGSTFNLSSGSVNVAGPISTSGSMIAGTGTFTVDGSTGNQTWGGTAPPLLHNLTVNKASGSLNPSVDLNVSGYLTLTNGTIVTGSNAVKVTSGQVLRTSGYIDGRLDVTHSTTGAKVYPLGTALGYSPVAVTIGNPGQLDVSIVSGAQPDNTGANANILQTYWTIHPGTVTGLVDLAFEWPASAVNGTEASYVLARYDGSSWTQPTATVTPAIHLANATGVSPFTGDWTVGAPASVTTSYDLEITTDGNAVAGVPESISITAKDGLGNTITSYTGDHTLVFAGATQSPSGDDPAASDKNSIDQTFGSNTVLTFTNGVATTNVTFYTNESVSLNASEPSASVTGTQAGITVAAGPATLLAVSDVNALQPLYANAPFTLSITATDSWGNPSNVVANTDITLSTGSCGGCTGTLGGTLTLQIPAGNTTANFSGLTYSVAEANVFVDVAATSGDTLGSNSTTLTFNTQASGVIVTNNLNSGAGSLRDAINQANSGACGTPCNITFDILPAGAYTFQLTTRLPNITVPVVIDGNTQDGFTGTPILAIDGSLFTGAAGFELSGGNSTLRGFVLQNLGGAAVELASANNVVQNCWIGTNLTATGAAGNGTGISITGNGNTVGGNVASSRNVISGNTTGILLNGFASGNTIRGNYIGTDLTASSAVGNVKGITLIQDAGSNTIGGVSPSDRNVISGNTGSGILLSGGSNISVDDARDRIETNTLDKVVNNSVLGNYIGVAANGASTLGNAIGVELSDDAEDTIVDGNVISGNGAGIVLGGSSVTSTTIQSNLIGVAADGTTAAGNVNSAITLTASSNNLIGGPGAGEGNDISHNGGAGVRITGAGTGNVIFSNSMHAYATLPIDLDGDGADVQDAGDADLGGNNNQNYPLISTANVNGANIDVTFSVNSSATGAGSMRVEVFHADGTGAPLAPLGWACFAGNNLVNKLITVGATSAVGTIAPGDPIVATATSFSDGACTTPADGTSEVSPATTVGCIPPAVTITGPTSTCPATPVTLDAGAGFLSYAWSTGDNTRFTTVTPTGTTTYTVTVTGANGCPGSDSHTVTLNTPTPVTVTGPATACDSAVLDAGAGFASYQWTTGAITRTITVTTSGTYGVTVTDANGCTSTGSHAVTIDTTPGNTITASGPTTFCDGGSVVLTASSAASYNWSTGATSQSITVTTSGSYSVQTTNGTCTATSAPMTVTVNPAPVATITGPATACDSATLNAGAGYASYLWNTGDTTPTINVTTTGIYSVTVTDANGCSGSDTHNISITTTPGNSITPGGPTTFCDGGSVTLTASTANTYLWSTGATTQTITVTTSGSYSVQTTNGSCTANSSPVTVTVNPAPAVTIIGPASACDSAVLDAGPGFTSYLWSNGDTTPTTTVTTNGTYSVTVGNGSGCTGSDSHTITITPSTAVSIAGPATACDSATLDAGSGFATYLWSTGATSQTINVTTGGTYSVTVTNGGGCSATDSHAVTINNSPTPLITGPTAACDNATLNAGAGFASYLWSTGDTTPTINVTTTGTYSVTVTDANGCSGSDSHNVTITVTTPVTITGPTSACDSATLDAGSGFATYLWNTGATSQTINVTTGGTYSVTVTNAGGCSATDSHAITISNTLTPVITGPTTACTPNSVTLDAGSGFTSYLWSTGATTQTISVNATGTYSVTVTGAGGCSGSDSHTVTFNTASPATITPDGPTTFCSGDSVTLTASAGASWLWSNGATTQSITVANSGSFSVTVTDAAGCQSTSPATSVTVNPLPIATITAPSSASANATGLTASVPAQAGATYLWGDVNATITSGQGTHAVMFSVGDSGTAKLTVVVTKNGCESSAHKNISINGTPQVDADLAIAKSAAATVQAGANLTYTLLVTNNGPANATDVTITDALPLGTTVVSIVDGPWTCSEFSGGIFCNGNLAASASSTVTITVTAPQQGGIITNTATVDAGNAHDPVLGNNSSSATTNVLGATPTCSNVPPALLAPANGAEVLSPVEFSWSAVTGASEYEVWLVTAEGTFLAGTTNTTSLSKALPSGASSWYVVARFTSDCTPLVSAQRTFTVSQSGGCTNAGPQVTSPAAGSTVGANVTFAWTPVPGAIGYRVWVEANGTAAQDVGTTDGAITLIADVPTGALIAYVDALFSGCPSGRSAPVAFNVAAPDPCAGRTAPATLSPSNGATIGSSSIDFSWTAAHDADGYRVWAQIDGAGDEVLGETSATSLTATIAGGTVRWWVEALYNGCASTESQRSDFTVPRRNDCSTQRPELSAPANNSTITAGNVVFNWSSVPNAIGYELWLSPEGGVPALIATTTSPLLAHTVAPGRYEWFVRALVDRCPTRDSQAFRFTFTPPAACLDNQRPIAIAPLSNAKAASPVSFAWSAPPGATSYDLFAIRGNQTQRIATSTSNHVEGVSLANGRLRWFVRAYFANGCTPLDSGEERLEIVAAPAACAALTAPEIASVGQISSGVPFTIQWTEIAGATSYQLQLASDSHFSDAQLISTDDTQHQLTRTNLGASPVALYARVRAIDSRCKPEANITPYGPSSAIFILPIVGTDAAAPVGGGIVTYNLPLGPELAGQSFTASSKEAWITVAPSSGIVPAGGLMLVVTANTNGLPLGTSMSAIRITLDTPAAAGSVRTNATTLVLPVVGVSKTTPVNPTAKSAPPPDALIIPAVAHADGLNSKFQSDIRVTNTSSKLLQYQVTFTPSGGNGLAGGKQTTFSIEPGRTMALDDVLRTWFGTGNDSSIGTLEVRPLTPTATTTPGAALRGLPDLVTFAASRTFNLTPNGTFGQYIPAVPFANFIGLVGNSGSSLSLQQIAQSDRYRTNLGIVEGSGEPASLLVKVFGGTGQKLTEFPVQLKGGEHTQLNAFLTANGIPSLDDGRVEISVIGGGGKVTAYASVLDNDTNDPLLVTPVTITGEGDSKWVMPGVADIDNGTANWQTDMRVFNGGTEDVTATFSFYSQNGGAAKTAEIVIPAGQVRQFDRTLSSVFGVANDGGAVHISTPSAARLVATARTYNQTSGGTYGQFISAVTPAESASRDTRALQVLQVEESSRLRTNLGLAEVTGNPVTVQLSINTPDSKTSAFTELTLAPNEFRQLPAILRAFGMTDTFNARITVRVLDGAGRVTAYGSMIDMQTNDPTYVPAQ